MKSYLLGQRVFHFVDGSMSYPPSHVSDISTDFFLHWKQYDQLHGSFQDLWRVTSHYVWRTLEKALASSSNSCIMQLHESFQDLWQGDALISMYMQQAKLLFNELVVVGRPISLEDFNLDVFHGLCGEFKDLVTRPSQPFPYPWVSAQDLLTRPKDWCLLPSAGVSK